MNRKSEILGLRSAVLVILISVSAGCSSDLQHLNAVSSEAAAPMAMMAGAPQAPIKDRALAYEHGVTVETTPELLPTRLRELEAACNADSTSGCTILDVSLQSHNNLPSGSIRMRLAPSGVEPIIALASKGGKLTGRTTRAEDLAEPVADTERQLALMTVHRDRLTELMKNKDLDIDQLITLSKELATVQSQIDALNTQRGQLRRRIDTQLLTISLTLPRYVYIGQHSPIQDSFREFGSHFREAVGMVIRFLAVAVPWLVIIVPGLFLTRLLWRWMSRIIHRREQRTSAV